MIWALVVKSGVEWPNRYNSSRTKGEELDGGRLRRHVGTACRSGEDSRIL
jgi:hypothetical protein